MKRQKPDAWLIEWRNKDRVWRPFKLCGSKTQLDEERQKADGNGLKKRVVPLYRKRRKAKK